MLGFLHDYQSDESTILKLWQTAGMLLFVINQYIIHKTYKNAT